MLDLTTVFAINMAASALSPSPAPQPVPNVVITLPTVPRAEMVRQKYQNEMTGYATLPKKESKPMQNAGEPQSVSFSGKMPSSSEEPSWRDRVAGVQGGSGSVMQKPSDDEAISFSRR